MDGSGSHPMSSTSAADRSVVGKKLEE